MRLIIRIYKYLFWKLGFDYLSKKVTKNYWNKGKNYEWIIQYIDGENLDTKSIIEIGSRDALDSIYFLKKFNFQNSYIFEPSIPGIKESLKNIEKSNLQNKIYFYPFAIGDKNELKTFYENTEKIDVPNIGASSFSSSNLNEFKKYKVPVFKLSEILMGVYSDFYLAMIDVEGHELKVLLNQKEIFTKFNHICLEVSKSTDELPDNQNLIQVHKILKEYGFEIVASKDIQNATIDRIINSEKAFVDILYSKI